MRCWVGIGSNDGAAERKVCEALERLDREPGIRLLRQSALYRSKPWGYTRQADFINAVAELETELDPPGLLQRLQGIESGMGRARKGPRWGPRVIDLDLVAYGTETRAAPGLTIPHPGVQERDFVLYPLAEIAPDLWLPGRGRVSTLAGRVQDRGSVPLAQ